MHRYLIVSIIAVLLLSLPATAAPRVKTVAEVYAPTHDVLLALAEFNVGLEEHDRPDYIRVVTDPATLADLRAAGFEVNVLIEDLDAWVAKRRIASRAAAPEPAPEEPPVLDHYFTHAEVVAFMQGYAAAYPELTALELLGTSVSGREIYGIKISDNADTNEDEPAFFYEGNIHGDEIATYVLGLHLIEWLLDNYATDPDVQALVDGHEIYVIPLINPDGNYDDPSYGRSRYNDNGVDLNRNNGFMWDPDESNPGSALHSEPETQILAEVWSRNQPYSAAISGHSGTVVVSLPWSYHTDSPPDWDEFDYLGELYCQICEDPLMDTWYQGSIGMYQMSGSTKDEYYGSYGAASWSMEITYTKECSWNTSASVMVEHEPSLMWLINEIDRGVHGTVTDVDTGDPLAATIFIDGQYYTFTDPEVGDFHKYLLEGNYTLTAQAAGYYPFTPSFSISCSAPADLTIQMTPEVNPKTHAYRWIHSEFPNATINHDNAFNALGRPDGAVRSLGYEGWVSLDLGPAGIADGSGVDISVIEGYTDGDEDFALYGKVDWDDSWTNIGDGSGTTDFDLNGTGLAMIRYIKIEDAGAARDGADASAYDGFDLDAVGTPTIYADFEGDPTAGAIPLTVHFVDESTGGPVQWAWDFGDGTTSDQPNPTHIYEEVGYYTISLTVTAANDTTDTLVKENYIHSYIALPEPEFTGAPTQGSGPLEVTFTNASTGPIDSYEWNFGDGSTSTEENPVHTFTDAGYYTVALSATGPGGTETRQRVNYIHVFCQPPTADFQADVQEGNPPLSVAFTNLSTAEEGCGITYLWDFGDGQQSPIKNPTHQYTSPGWYDVTLTSTTEGGDDVETKTAYIHVLGEADDDDDTADDDDDDDNDDNNDDNDDATDDDAADDDDDTADDDVAGDADDDDDDSSCCG